MVCAMVVGRVVVVIVVVVMFEYPFLLHFFVRAQRFVQYLIQLGLFRSAELAEEAHAAPNQGAAAAAVRSVIIGDRRQVLLAAVMHQQVACRVMKRVGGEEKKGRDKRRSTAFHRVKVLTGALACLRGVRQHVALIAGLVYSVHVRAHQSEARWIPHE